MVSQDPIMCSVCILLQAAVALAVCRDALDVHVFCYAPTEHLHALKRSTSEALILCNALLTCVRTLVALCCT